MLSKSIFLTHLDTPMHLWAQVNTRFETEMTAFQRHMFEQGNQVHAAADKFLQTYTASHYANAEYQSEYTFSDGRFKARIDGLVHDVEADVYDLYEVKSSTNVKPQHIYDLAFQRLLAEGSIKVRHVHLVHTNKDYVRQGDLDLEGLFVVENLDEQVEDVRQEVLSGREEAFEIAQRESSDGIPTCLNPKTCPCPSLCHPDLPEHSIYDLPRLGKAKKRALIDAGILAIKDIPPDFALSRIQALHAQAVKSGEPVIDYPAVKASLAKLEYPLYFLDYETFNPALPQYDGYRPHQHMVFQYSLHVYDSQTAEPRHFEILATQTGDPGRVLVARLAEDIGETGSVVVWNQSFEATRNKDMAALYPEYAEMLLGINARMYDLMKVFSQGHYVHPDFHGSASIKAVLPALVGEDSYEDLAIPAGDEAMTAWAEMMRGVLTEDMVAQTKQSLLDYCELDTWAMVRNWQVLAEL